MSLSRNNVSVVLVGPTQSENVGSVARAMNNMGVDDLRLVDPCDYQNLPARQMAANSQEILANATVFPSLAEAVRDRQLIIGTTARIRDRNARISELRAIHELVPGEECEIALVFGRESSGLTNAALCLCNAWIHIPTFGKSSSLNLAQAVMVTLYELSKLYEMPSRPWGKQTPKAKSNDIEGLKHHLFQVLEQIHFLKKNQEETIWRSFSDLIGRAQLTEIDVRLMRGFFHKIEVTLRRLDKSR